MGFLDSFLGDLAGSAMGGQSGQSATNPLGSILGSLAGGNQQQSGSLLVAAMTLLQQSGGIGGALKQLQSSGFGAQADSWVGTSANMAVSGDQVHQTFGPAMGTVASQLGMSTGQASSAMAQILPELINQLTPHGQIPNDSDDMIARGLAMLRR
jgi:uncharacterized protein YidB (DUF937 family)